MIYIDRRIPVTLFIYICIYFSGRYVCFLAGTPSLLVKYTLCRDSVLTCTALDSKFGPRMIQITGFSVIY